MTHFVMVGTFGHSNMVAIKYWETAS